MEYHLHVHLTGAADVTVVIRAYNATGELDIYRGGPFILSLGTRVLLTCYVIGLTEGSEALRYSWYHNCTGRLNSRCPEIRDGDPYYRVMSDILLVNVPSWDQGGRYYCAVDYLKLFNNTEAIDTEDTATSKLSVAG